MSKHPHPHPLIAGLIKVNKAGLFNKEELKAKELDQVMEFFFYVHQYIDLMTKDIFAVKGESVVSDDLIYLISEGTIEKKNKKKKNETITTLSKKYKIDIGNIASEELKDVLEEVAGSRQYCSLDSYYQSAFINFYAGVLNAIEIKKNPPRDEKNSLRDYCVRFFNKLRVKKISWQENLRSLLLSREGEEDLEDKKGKNKIEVEAPLKLRALQFVVKELLKKIHERERDKTFYRLHQAAMRIKAMLDIEYARWQKGQLSDEEVGNIYKRLQKKDPAIDQTMLSPIGKVYSDDDLGLQVLSGEVNNNKLNTIIKGGKNDSLWTCKNKDLNPHQKKPLSSYQKKKKRLKQFLVVAGFVVLTAACITFSFMSSGVLSPLFAHIWLSYVGLSTSVTAEVASGLYLWRRYKRTKPSESSSQLLFNSGFAANNDLANNDDLNNDDLKKEKKLSGDDVGCRSASLSSQSGL